MYLKIENIVVTFNVDHQQFKIGKYYFLSLRNNKSFEPAVNLTRCCA